MPTYFPSNAISDVATVYDMSNLHNTTSTIAISVISGTNQTVEFITPEYYPNSTGQTSTNGTVVLELPATNMNINVVATKVLVSSTGTQIAVGTSSASTAITNSPVTLTNLDDPTTTTTNCSDRLMLRLVFSTANTMTQTATLGTDRIGTYAAFSINHNTIPGCTLLRKRPQIGYRK